MGVGLYSPNGGCLWANFTGEVTHRLQGYRAVDDPRTLQCGLKRDFKAVYITELAQPDDQHEI